MFVSPTVCAGEPVAAYGNRAWQPFRFVSPGVADIEEAVKLLGVDTGGTFTDLILYDGGEFRVHKQLSTPDAPEKAIIEGVRSLGLSPRRAPDVVHGSTVGTNAVLEGKGVKTACSFLQPSARVSPSRRTATGLGSRFASSHRASWTSRRP